MQVQAHCPAVLTGPQAAGSQLNGAEQLELAVQCHRQAD